MLLYAHTNLLTLILGSSLRANIPDNEPQLKTDLLRISGKESPFWVSSATQKGNIYDKRKKSVPGCAPLFPRPRRSVVLSANLLTKVPAFLKTGELAASNLRFWPISPTKVCCGRRKQELKWGQK